jgi:hypothetical protein
LPFRGDFEKDGYDFIRWQAMTAGYLDKVNASKEDKLLALYRAIRGDARTLLSEKNFEEISDVFAALENVHIQVGSIDSIFNIRQKENESVGECYVRILIEIICSKLITLTGENEIIMHCLRKALKPEILEKLNNTCFQKLSSMLYSAKQFELDLRESKPNTTKIETALALISEEIGLDNAEIVKKYIFNIQNNHNITIEYDRISNNNGYRHRNDFFNRNYQKSIIQS